MALAIENNDLSSLKTFRAREVSPQLVVNIMNPYELSFSKYFDDSFNKALANSSMEIFEWFLEDYTIKVNDREEVNWIYPFISELACECIKLKEPLKIQKILNAILTYNKKVFEILHATYLTAARRAKEMCYPKSYESVFKSIGRDYHLNQEKNFVCLWPYFLRDINPVALNFVQLKCSSKDLKTQTTIDSINEYYDKIINLPNSQIKNS